MMSFQCLNPYVAVKQFDLVGSKILKLYSKSRQDYNLGDLKHKYGSDNVFTLPCGQCESCKRNKANDWAIRCALEAKYHKYNYFLTLTYDDIHLPYGSWKDVQAFLDNLNGTDDKRTFKYFAAQEFGELNNRLHFHMILFCDFELKLYDPVKIGNFYQYKSDLIDKYWKCGFYTLSPFETNCARYVAKYTSKNSKLYMSRNLAKSYFLDHFEEILDDNFRVYGDFGGQYKAYVPDAFIRWFDEIDPLLTKTHKKLKKDLAKLVLNEKLRSKVLTHEEDIIKSECQRVIEKGISHKKL